MVGGVMHLLLRVRREAAFMVVASTGLLAPNRSSRYLAVSDHERELERNTQLQASSPGTQAGHFASARGCIEVRLSDLRWTYLVSLVVLASALAVAWLCVARLRIELTASSAKAAAITSAGCFVWATLGRLCGSSWKRDTVIERFDTLIFRVAFWLGTFFGFMALA